ncbi:4-hydroxybenzoate polyprenyl transferase [Candidatus Symbiobacter mobilis CR]|uniref:4-hydroxybenzoate polyprenyl transferase n=1 Tax=Candidatus Symbiobacter mobilis CR TaxID=946483 RepID=U5N701_9BURK|nr:4-hydroxybenzoate polyprenyl transferase [Candidatus Symbiobacter mobilis CR]
MLKTVRQRLLTDFLAHRKTNSGLGPPPFRTVSQVAWHYRLLRTRRREECFRSFRANHWLGCTLFVGLMLAMGHGRFTPAVAPATGMDAPR